MSTVARATGVVAQVVLWSMNSRQRRQQEKKNRKMKTLLARKLSARGRRRLRV
jgi:hypothetical protein